jgi:hypothetical protein
MEKYKYTALGMANYIFLLLTNYIYTTHYFRRHSPPILSIYSLPVSSVGETSLGCRAENWQLGHLGLQLANALPTELRRTQGWVLILKTIFGKCCPWLSEYFKNSVLLFTIGTCAMMVPRF